MSYLPNPGLWTLLTYEALNHTDHDPFGDKTISLQSSQTGSTSGSIPPHQDHSANLGDG